MPSGTGLLLVGPAGCGKHTAVLHMLHLLDRLPKRESEDGSPEAPYTCVFLDGEELEEPGEGFESGRERINALLDDCYERRRGLFLVLEDTAALPWSRKLYRFLETQLAAYYLSRGRESLFPGPKDRPAEALWAEEEGDLPPFFLVLMEEKEPALPALLRSRLQLCRMSRPNLLRRRRFLMSRNLGNLRLDMDALHPGQGLAELTEGLSYAQLEDLINSLSALTADLTQAVEQEEEDVLRREQAPEEPLGELQRQVWQKAESLIDRLPELLGQRGIAVSGESALKDTDEQNFGIEQEPVPAPQTESGLSGWNEESEISRLEKLPVSQLAREYFGKEIKLEPERLVN